MIELNYVHMYLLNSIIKLEKLVLLNMILIANLYNEFILFIIDLCSNPIAKC